MKTISVVTQSINTNASKKYLENQMKIELLKFSKYDIILTLNAYIRDKDYLISVTLTFIQFTRESTFIIFNTNVCKKIKYMFLFRIFSER